MRWLISALLSISFATMWLFNFSAGFIGGIWLFFTGGGSIILSGLIISFLMPIVYSLVTLPTLLFIPLLNKFTDERKRLSTSIIAFIISVYTNFVLAFWVAYVFGWNLNINNLPPLAVWLWTYSIVMSPISYMAYKEGSNSPATTLGVLFTQLSFFIFSVGFLFDDFTIGYFLEFIFLLLFSIITVALGLYHLSKQRSKERNTKSFISPKFYDVDDTFVKVDSNGETVFGTTEAGNPFPPVKALAEGFEISEEEFIRRTQAVSSRD